MNIIKANFSTLEEAEAQLSERLLGRRVVDFSLETSAGSEDGKLILDNGVELFISGNLGCGGCVDGHFYLTKLSRVENIITSVKLKVRESQAENDRFRETVTFELFLFAGHEEINALQVEGEVISGYYGEGFTVEVRRPVTD